MISTAKKFIRLNSFEEVINKYQYFVFDCDGVVWRESKPLPNAVETIKKLKILNKDFYFLSNTNKNSRGDLQNKFKQMNIEVNFENIYTSSYLIAKYISDNFPKIKHLFLIGSRGLEKELEDMGFIIYGGPEGKNIPNLDNFTSDAIESTDINENIEACVCGIDEKFNFGKLAYANLVIRKTELFFGTNYDTEIRLGKNFGPGSYSLISALEVCSRIKAKIVTKPDPRSLEIIMSDHKVDLETSRDKIIMLGDNLNTDIKFANNNLIDSILLLTGVTRENDINKIEALGENENNMPTYILKNFE